MDRGGGNTVANGMEEEPLVIVDGKKIPLRELISQRMKIKGIEPRNNRLVVNSVNYLRVCTFLLC